jgi:hypothetical protein
MSDLIELLEMRVSRLERIVAAIGAGPGSSAKLHIDSIVYKMDDPRLVLFGAYGVESAGPNTTYRWFGQTGLIQMVFPHGRGSEQGVRLLVHPMKGVELALIRIIVDEATIAPQITTAAGGLTSMSFQIPAGFGNQTEIQMKDVPVVCPKDQGASDIRLLSFRVYQAEFRAVVNDPPPSAAKVSEAPTKGRARKGRS